jgi:hypothetical protein
VQTKMIREKIKQISPRKPEEKGVLTVGACEGGPSDEGAAADLVGREAPIVPDGLPSIWMYMNRLLSLSPHFSAG